MKCVFCDTDAAPEKRWHIDCLDSAIEEEYGMQTMNEIWKFVADRSRKMVPAWLTNIMRKGTTDGDRHRMRYVVMITLFKQGFTDDEIAVFVRKFNDKCRKPEDERVVETHISSTLKRMRR